MHCKNLGNCYLIRRDLISMIEFVMSSQVSLITSWATLLKSRQCQVLNSFSKLVMFTGVDELTENLMRKTGNPIHNVFTCEHS